MPSHPLYIKASFFLLPHFFIFLSASMAVRAERWRKDQELKGRTISLEQAEEEVKSRDERDANRILAPLSIPEGAIIIDDSNLHKDQVLAVMERALASQG